MAAGAALPALMEPLFAKVNAWKSVVLHNLCVLHLELPAAARARVKAVFTLGAIEILG